MINDVRFSPKWHNRTTLLSRSQATNQYDSLYLFARERERGGASFVESKIVPSPPLLTSRDEKQETYQHNLHPAKETLLPFQHSLILSSTSQSKNHSLSKISLTPLSRQEKRERDTYLYCRYYWR